MEALLVFLARSAVHSAVATTVVELLVPGWRVGDPRSRARLRSVALLVPAVTSLAAPLATSAGWPAALRVGPWLDLLFPLFVVAGAFGAAVLLGQELWPHWASPRTEPRLTLLEAGASPRLDAALPEPRPPCYELDGGGAVIGVRRLGGTEAIVIGEALLGRLDDQELRAVLAHEAAHLGRGDLGHRRWMYALRALLFASPFALLTFRRLVHDSEEACDDAAVRATGTPMALAAGLLKVHGSLRPLPAGAGVLARMSRGVTRHARAARLRGRVRRLLDGAPSGAVGAVEVWATALALVALLLGVV